MFDFRKRLERRSLLVVGLLVTLATTFFSQSAKGQSPVTISTLSLPDGKVGDSYAATISATGGTPPYSWGSVFSVPGLTFNSTGNPANISGVLTTAGVFSFTVALYDSSGPPPPAGLPAGPLQLQGYRSFQI